MVNINGRYNQVHGPFPAGKDLLASDGAIGEKTPETSRPIISKIGIIAEPDTEVTINDATVTITEFGVLELDGVVNITKLIFPNGADATTVIDFVY